MRKSVTWVLSSPVRVDFAEIGFGRHVDVGHNRVPLPSPKGASPDSPKPTNNFLPFTVVTGDRACQTGGWQRASPRRRGRRAPDNQLGGELDMVGIKCLAGGEP